MEAAGLALVQVNEKEFASAVRSKALDWGGPGEMTVMEGEKEVAV